MKSLFGLRGRLIVSLILLFTALGTTFRLIFFGVFRETGGQQVTSGDFFRSFWLGLRFDLRVAVALTLPVILFAWFLNPLQTNFRRKSWSAYYALVTGLFVASYLLDFGYYAYLHGRVNATVLHFLENFWISAEMVWQTYPILPSSAAIATLLVLSYWAFYKWVFVEETVPLTPFSSRRKWLTASGLTVAILLAAHSKLSQYPLRWSEAFFSTDPFVSALALNPIHYFFDTLAHRDQDYNVEKVRAAYPLVSAYLGVEKPDSQTLNFGRSIAMTPLPGVEKDRPNVVFFIMESFAAYKTGILGHPMNPTPHFDALAKQSLVFNRFYVPCEGTARSIFGYISGVPDVTRHKTSSRNPLIVDQNTVVNAFTDYDKFYFIGGSANWGNIRGIISHNIPGIELIEEGMFHHSRTDVWGIADLHLFEEAFERLSNRPEGSKPFFAFIQSAGFHRPYTIPVERGDFQIENLSEEQLKHSGFISNDEYNSMRFADYSLGRFFELAKKSNFYDNTIFVIVGDHGLPDDGADHVPTAEKIHLLSRFHVPLVLHSPKYWPKGQINTTVATSPDVLPTLAGLAGRPFPNGAFGRNLFDPKFANDRYAFTYVYYQTPPEIGLYTGDYYTTGTPGRVDHMYAMTSASPDRQIQNEKPKEFERLKELTDGLHETAKYLLYHNPSRLNQASQVP